MNRKERRATAKSTAPDAQRLFADAVNLHRAGRLKECVTKYRQALQGLPQAAEIHHNLGVALKGLGKLDQAMACYRQALTLAPDYADAHNSLGNALCDLGRLEEAVTSFQHAIHLVPTAAAAHNNLGTALLDLGQPQAAADAFRQAIACQPDYAEAHNNLGAALADLHRDQDALACYDQALALEPRHPRAWGNRAAILLRLGRVEDAVAAARQAVQLAPKAAPSLNTLGNALQAADDLSAAAEAYAQAVQAAPHLPELHDNLGNVLGQLGRSAQAEACCRHALKLAPDFAKAHNNLGTALKDQGKRQDAEACFRRALELAPHMPAAHTNLGMSLLYHGDFAAGWREFEWRWGTGKLSAPAFAQPRWQGEDIAGKTILLTAEQGLGDSLQFARFAQPIAALGARVILQVQPSLVRLLATIPGVAQTIASDQAPPPFDVHLPLMSVPLVLGTTLDTIPAAMPYLHAPHAVAQDGPGRKIGLVWAGDPRPHDLAANAADQRRSVPLADLNPVLQVPGCRFFSLQMGAARQQTAALPAPLRPIDLMADVCDFSDTAARVAGLDLIIAVDTSVAHLAAAMGKPVWLLSRYDGCWRWLADRPDSPWYPTLRLFRQSQPGDWNGVVAQVVRALEPA